MNGSIDTHDLPATSASPGRRVRVWTPEGYERASQRYPVLYMQDGQNLFGSARSGESSWNADVTAQRLITAGVVQPLILVGIDNAGDERADEYTPVAWKGCGGRAWDYAALLLDEIKPFVDGTYRTRTGPEWTVLGGSSLGGLFSLFAGLRRPDVFGGILAMSPSVFWGDDHILEAVAAVPHGPPRPPLSPQPPISPRPSISLRPPISPRPPISLRPPISPGPRRSRIWLDAGAHETATMRAGVRKLSRVLRARGWRSDGRSDLATLHVREDRTGRHDEESWGRRLAGALRYLFPHRRGGGARRRG